MRNGELVITGRLKDVIIKNQTKDAEIILSEIFIATNDFGNKTKWKDDATVVVIKRNK